MAPLRKMTCNLRYPMGSRHPVRIYAQIERRYKNTDNTLKIDIVRMRRGNPDSEAKERQNKTDGDAGERQTAYV